MEQTIQQLQQYLANNEPEAALKKMHSIFSIANSELVNDVILVTGQFRKLKSDVRIGILDYATENIRHNQILNATLSLVAEIQEEPARFSGFYEAENQLDQLIEDRGRSKLPLWVKDSLFERIAFVKEKKASVTLLWVSDSSAGDRHEIQLLEAIGIEKDSARTSAEALQKLTEKKYDLLISDIAREGENDEGLKFLNDLNQRGVNLPVIFYVGLVSKAKGVPPFAFGIADMPDDLLHLVLDVIERKY